MLVLGMEAKFHKKAKSIITFSCRNGIEIKNAIEKSINTNESQTVIAQTEGRDVEGNLVAEFWFTWTFKPRS